jgi:hypothetical protein
VKWLVPAAVVVVALVLLRGRDTEGDGELTVAPRVTAHGPLAFDAVEWSDVPLDLTEGASLGASSRAFSRAMSAGTRDGVRRCLTQGLSTRVELELFLRATDGGVSVEHVAWPDAGLQSAVEDCVTRALEVEAQVTGLTPGQRFHVRWPLRLGHRP